MYRSAKSNTKAKFTNTSAPGESFVNTRSNSLKNQHLIIHGNSSGTPLTSCPNYQPKSPTTTALQLERKSGNETLRQSIRSSSVNSVDSLELLEIKLTKNLSKVITEQFRELEELLSQKLEQVIASFNGHLSSLREELDVMRGEVCEIRSELENVRRGNRLSDAIITGVPFTQSENVGEMLTNISSIIDHTLSPYATAFRAKSNHSNQSSRSTPPLVVKFSSASEQRMFLQKFWRHGAVRLNQISPSFVSDNRINVFESLSRSNNQILRKALGLVRNKLIHSAYTRQGLVNVRLKRDDSPLVITSMNALDNLLAEENTSGA